MEHKLVHSSVSDGQQRLEHNDEQLELELVLLASLWRKQLGNRDVGRQRILLIGCVREHQHMSIRHGEIRHVILFLALS